MKMDCRNCHTPTDRTHQLCEHCELDTAMRLLRLIPWTAACREFLDATAHYGGHAPGRTNLPTAPLPIRLEVIDHLDDMTGVMQEWWRRLLGVDPVDWHRDLCPDLTGCLIDIAGHPRLPLMPGIDHYLRELDRLERRTLAIIDTSDTTHRIGHCLNPLCGVELSARIGDIHVECPMCGKKWMASSVRLGLLRDFVDSDRCFTAIECAALFREAGIPLSGGTIRSWKARGLLRPVGRDGRRDLFRVRDVFNRATRAPRRRFGDCNRQLSVD